MDDTVNDRALSPHIRPVPQYILSQGSAEQAPFEQPRSLHDYLRVLFNRRWLIGGGTLFIVLLAGIYSLLATRLYTTSAILKVGTYAPLLPGAQLEDMLRQQTREQDYFNTQVELLGGLSVADSVLLDPQVGDRTKDYLKHGANGILSIFEPLIVWAHGKTETEMRDSGAYRHPLKMLEKYKSIVDVQPVRKTALIKVSVTTADPNLSAEIANTHADRFIELVRAERQKETGENILFLKGQADQLQDKVAQLERDLASYAEANTIVALNKDENIVVKRMSELSRLLTEATAKRVKSETVSREAEAGSGLLSAAFDDKTVLDLRVALKEAESEYAMLGEKFKPEYPRMVALHARVESLKKTLDQQRAQIVAGLAATYKADLEAEKALNEQLEIEKSRAFELSRREVQYNILKREYESTRDLHQAVLRQLKEVQVSSESTGSNIVLGDRAAVPVRPSSPRPLFDLALALILGFLGCCTIALTLDLLDTTIRTPEEAQQLFSTPVLGVIPLFQEERNTTRAQLLLPSGASDEAAVPATCQTNVVTLQSPRSVASESFRAIRTGILLSSADNPPRVILITSAKQSEGKTTVATNVAAALGQVGSRTIIIDADLRRPNVHKLLGDKTLRPGLVEYLTGQKELSEVLVEGSNGFAYISSGTIPPNPAELLGSKRMAELIVILRAQYDYVLIDAPPIIPVTDAVFLSRVTDGVVMVVRGGDTSRHIVRESLRRLSLAGAKILGMILNEVNFKSGDYYYYYRQTYSYYEDESKRAQSA